MNKIHLGLCLLLFSCGGSLSDEQRKKLKEGMESQKIVRVTDSEIMSLTLKKAHEVYAELEKVNFTTDRIDSLEAAHKVQIKYLTPGAGNAKQLEQELIDAYISGVTQGAAQENLQKIWIDNEKKDYDSLLYSKPSITRLPDQTERLDGLWNIYLSRKEIVLDLSRDK